MSHSFKKIGVVGAGQMGSGIAQVVAMQGTSCVVYDIASKSLDKAKASIEKSLQKLSEKGKLSKSPSEVLKNLDFVSDLQKLSACDLVIEAATENISLKKEIFQKLDSLLAPGSIIGTNTSSISITQLAASTQRPDRFIGVHFMNPVPLMKLVEVISGTLTSSATLESIQKLIVSLDKTMVQSKDYPGFIVNRILMPMINEAVYALYEGVGSVEAIDTGMKLGTNQPMGPLELADFIGLDTCLSIMEVLHEGLGDSKYRPCPLLRNYVAAGLLGRKSGRGFYQYSAEGKVVA